MKVLNVSFTLDPITGGGVAERTFQMSRHLARAGVDCSVLTLESGLTAQRRNELSGVRLVALTCLLRRFYVPLPKLRTIQKAVAAADVIHLIGHWNLLNVIVYWFARRMNKPYVVCPAGELKIFGRSQRLKRLFNALVGRRLVKQAAGHIAITADEAAQFRLYGVEADRVTVIPNGIDSNDFTAQDHDQFRRVYGLGDARFILFMGRLNEIKGPDLLLDAFCALSEKVPEYQLVFVGPDCGMRSRLEQRANAAEMGDRVHFLGYLGGEEKSRAYHAAQLLAIPSRQEAMSIVVLEAGICRTPVLLTDQCGFDEVEAIDGGRVVPTNVDGLVRGLSEMLGNEDQLPSQGARLYDFVSSQFVWNIVIDNYCELYRRIISGESERSASPRDQNESRMSQTDVAA